MAEQGARPQYVPTQDEIADAISVALTGTTTKPTSKELQKILESENPTWKLPERRVAKFLKRYLKKTAKGEAVENGEDEDDQSISSQTSFARRASLATRKSLSRLTKKRNSNANDGDTAKTIKDDASVSSQSSFAHRARKGLTRLVSKKKIEREEKKKKKSRFSIRRKKKKGDEPADAAPPTIVTGPVDEVDPNDTNLLSPVTLGGDVAEEEEEDEEDLLLAEPKPELELEAAEGENGNATRAITYDDDNDGKKAEGLCTGCTIL